MSRTASTAIEDRRDRERDLEALEQRVGPLRRRRTVAKGPASTSVVFSSASVESTARPSATPAVRTSERAHLEDAEPDERGARAALDEDERGEQRERDGCQVRACAPSPGAAAERSRTESP
jgi:hypothetical protein